MNIGKAIGEWTKAHSILRRAPSAGDPRPSAVARAAIAIERSEATRLAAMPADGQ